MRCNNCQNNLSNTAKFCGKCGEVVVTEPERRQLIICPGCQSECNPLAKFCGKCGCRFTVATAAVEAIPDFPASAPILPMVHETVPAHPDAEFSEPDLAATSIASPVAAPPLQLDIKSEIPLEQKPNVGDALGSAAPSEVASPKFATPSPKGGSKAGIVIALVVVVAAVLLAVFTWWIMARGTAPGVATPAPVLAPASQTPVPPELDQPMPTQPTEQPKAAPIEEPAMAVPTIQDAPPAAQTMPDVPIPSEERVQSKKRDAEEVQARKDAARKERELSEIQAQRQRDQERLKRANQSLDDLLK